MDEMKDMKKDEMSRREEDVGASEMSKPSGDLSKGMDEKIESAAEMGGREEDMGASEMGKMGEMGEKDDMGKM